MHNTLDSLPASERKGRVFFLIIKIKIHTISYRFNSAFVLSEEIRALMFLEFYVKHK